DLDYGKDTAFEFDNEVLVEPFKKGIKEYNLAGCKVGDEFLFSIVEEPSKDGHLDFDKKYLDFSRSSSVNEAEISKELKDQMREAFKKIYDPLFQGSIIRCDFFVDEGKVYLNEINPIPGSLANYLFDDFGGIISQLVENLPKYQKIPVSYKYINSIQSAKGKA
ncbi:MAG: D-alanine--D-alanine ligase, partial [Campylobacterales bacterium]|nr:D-alanine--D-alanine ligase [Campylobacterales bacterium]